MSLSDIHRNCYRCVSKDVSVYANLRLDLANCSRFELVRQKSEIISNSNKLEPDISVICGAYNAADSLVRSLDSVLSQSGVSIELIVVNDGSTDATGKILDEYARRDRRVRIIHQLNQGLTRSLIAGCNLARGRCIARMDMDDVSLPNRLARQLQILDHNPEVAFVSCWAVALGPGAEVLYEVRRPEFTQKTPDGMLQHFEGPSHHGSVMMRRDCYEQVGGYRWQFYFAQDWDLWLRLAQVGKFACVPDFLYEFRVIPTGISSKYRCLQFQLGELIQACRQARLRGASEKELLDLAAQLRPGLAQPIESDAVSGDYFIGRCLLKRRDRRAAMYFRKVIAERPWMLKSWIGWGLSTVRDQCFSKPRKSERESA